MPDISEWLNFNFYNWCWFWNAPAQDLTEDKADLGRFLGVTHQISSNMCYWVLTDAGKVLAKTTVQRVTNDDLQIPATQEKMTNFTHKITKRLDDQNHIIPMPIKGLTLDDADGDPNDEPKETTQPDQDDYTKDTYDAYLSAQLLIPHGDSYISEWVTKCIQDEDGNPVGRRHQNSMLDTCQYKVQFGDGSTSEYSANLIAKNLYVQCDPKGCCQLVFKEITDHQKNAAALPKEQGYVVGYNGN